MLVIASIGSRNYPTHP